MDKEYKFGSNEIESQIPHLVEKQITEFTISDPVIAGDKKRIIKIMNLIAMHAPDVFISIYVKASVIDREVLMAAGEIFCSLEIPLECSSKGGKLLFDKKFYSNKAKLLNDFGLTFGFELFYAQEEGDNLKSFTDRLDFAIQQYPNHIDFPQTQNEVEKEELYAPKVTGIFSAQDIRYARDIAFACRVFYSAGRAVPWFLSVLKPLKIYPSKFLSDFAEWQRVNNCDYKSGFVPESEKHISLEKMQLLFTNQKYEEKGKHDLFMAVTDLIKLNGAISRLCAEDEESVVNSFYNPDDIFSPESMDLTSFVENVCMENCKVKICFVQNEPNYIVL